MKIYQGKDVERYYKSSNRGDDAEDRMGIRLPEEVFEDENPEPPQYKLATIKIFPKDIYYWMESYSPQELWESGGDDELLRFDETTLKLTSGEELAVCHTLEEFEQILNEFSKPKRKTKAKKDTTEDII